MNGNRGRGWTREHPGAARRAVRAGGGRAGITLVEILIVVVLLGIAAAIGIAGYGELRQSSVVERSAERVAADIALARSYAVQRGEDVTLAADEPNRSYEIRAASGGVLATRSYAADTDLPLTLLDVTTADDDLTFNSRGFLQSGGTVEIDVGRFGDTRSVFVNVAGRTRVEAP